jgi:glycosyltransferase involved in cell wall biosynthesis
MRVLFLSLTFPVPANNGHKMRTLGLLRALAAEGHDTTLLTFAQPHEVNGNHDSLRALCRDMEVIPLTLTNLSAATDYLQRLRMLASHRPYTEWRFRSREMRARLMAHLRHRAFDAIICDSVFSATNLPHTTRPVLVNNVDIEHLIIKRYIAHERNLAKRAYAWLECHKLRRWEHRVCSRATVSMACSEHDRHVLRTLCPGARIMVVPNVVDTDQYNPTTSAEDPYTLLYQGGMDWYPNRDAVEFFISAVLPELQRLDSRVKFVVGGRNTSEKFRRRFAKVPGVEFTGTVPDMQPVIARAAVCVVPLRIGSGTRLKILEAAAMRKAIVSTRLGVEGLEFVDGRDIVLADEPQAFARAVAILIADPARRRILGHAARQRTEQQYSFPVLRSALRTLLGASLSNQSEPPSTPTHSSQQ